MKTSRTLLRIFLFCCLCCTLTIAKAQWVSIPDTNLGTWLNNYGFASCLSGNNTVGWQLDTICLASQNQFSLSINNANITNLQGLQYFTQTYFLECRFNNLGNVTALPPNLSDLYISNSHVTNLPYPLSPYLLYLDVSDNDLYDNIFDLPYSLLEYQCRNNHTQFLPFSLPYSLQYMDCQSNNITSIPALPPSLTGLNCDDNFLYNGLPALPSGLRDLNCGNTHLTSLPALSDSLRTLNAGLNNFSGGLPVLPAFLLRLDCNQCSMTALPALPAGLTYLNCSWNAIPSLPTLPATLDELYCGRNVLHSLPALPSKMTTLSCWYNRFGVLPTLPDSLQVLDCSDDSLRSMPALPLHLYSLDCSNNDITSFVNIPPSLYTFKLNYNLHLSCLPRVYQSQFYEFRFINTALNCLPSRFTAQLYDINPATRPLCDPASGCEFYYNVAGNVHYDNSANCTADSLNPGAAITSMKVRLKQGGSVIQQFYTFNSGGYSFKTPSYGSYTVDIDTTTLPISVVCPQSGVRGVAITAIDSVKKYENFGMQCSGIDFGVANLYDSRFRPTFQTTVHINAGNMSLIRYNAACGAGTSGTVTTTFTNAITYIGPAPGALTPSSVSGNTLTYNIADLNTLTNGSLDIILQTDAGAVLGSSVCITVTVTPSAPDANTADNTLTQCVPIRNSYDPNYKEVYPVRIQPGAADWLTYTIHFQNTGSDTAYLVVLRDTLSQYVDASSFQYLASSHHAVIQLDHNAMTFTFPHINLVDSATNPALSQGWIQYRVKANPGLTNGTSINNTAYIYFDNNPAVVTNTATTTVTTATCSDITVPVSQSICAGDTFTFYGQRLTVQGTYNDTMPRAGGCDSIISLTLSVRPNYITPVGHDTICNGDVLQFHGQSLTAAGTYTATLQSTDGCDSIVSVALQIRPSLITSLPDDTICAGSSLSWHGQTITTGGLYTDTLQTVRGCDSIITLWVQVRTAPAVTWSQSDTTYFRWCDPSRPPIPLHGVSPTGGIFSGPFVSGNSLLVPNVSWLDTLVNITYTYSDSSGCSNSVSKNFSILLGCEGINDIATSDIQLYPNPNSGTFILHTSNSRNSSYIITNMIGEVIEEKAITSDTQSIDLQGAAAGVYTLIVKGAQSTRQVKFTVVR